MAINVTPAYSGAADIQWGATALTTANTAKDGTGTVLTVFLADSVNGGLIGSVKASSIGTNTATVLRLFLNNGSTNATPGNNILLVELTLSATTLSEVAAQPPYIVPLNIWLPAGYKINATIGTTVAAGYMLSATGGKMGA